jgi:osmotically-inducible protein OsmY
MQHFNPLRASFLALALVSALGCAGSATQESTGEYIDDTVITTRVKAAFIGDEQVKAGEVNVETFKGVVQLSGFVSSEAAMARAVEIARGIDGVASVKNDMRIR